MTASLSDAAISMDEALRLRRFLNWALGVTVALGGADLINILIAPGPAALLDAGADVVLIGNVLLIRALVVRGRTMAAIWMICATLWLFALVLAWIDPVIVTTIVFLPLLGIVAILPYIDRRTARVLSLGAIVVTGLTLVIAEATTMPAASPPTGIEWQAVGSLAGVCSLIFLLLNQFHGRLNATVRQTLAANLALQQSQAELETQVAARTAELESLLKYEQERSAVQARLLAENEQQRATIRALSVPVLPIASHVLVMPIIGTVDAERLEILRQEALCSLERMRAAELVLDITGVSVVDRDVAQGLVSVVQAARLLGVRVWLVGIRPEVAQSLVELQVDLSSMRTGATLQDVLPHVLPHAATYRF